MTNIKIIRFKGEYIALIPDDKNGQYIGSYAHMGQHSDASRELLRYKARFDKGAIELLQELINIGYNDINLLSNNKLIKK